MNLINCSTCTLEQCEGSKVRLDYVVGDLIDGDFLAADGSANISRDELREIVENDFGVESEHVDLVVECAQRIVAGQCDVYSVSSAESEASPAALAYGPRAHDSLGNSIGGQLIPYELIESE